MNTNDFNNIKALQFKNNEELGKNHEYESAEPSPLFREPSVINIFPSDKMPPAFGGLALKIKEFTQAHENIIGHSILSAIALATQSLGNIRIDSRRIPLSNFFSCIASSGMRKSAVNQIVYAPHKEWQNTMADRYRPLIKKYNDEFEIYQAKKRVAINSKKESEISKLAELAEPVRPNTPKLIIQETTIEGLEKFLIKNNPAVGFITDEGGRFIGGHSMNSENQLKTIASFSSLWDGNALTRLRSGDEMGELSTPRLTIDLMIQPDVAWDFVLDQKNVGQGFLSRFLITEAPQNSCPRKYKDCDITGTDEFHEYRENISNLLKQNENDFFKKERNDYLPELRLTEEAKQEYIIFFDAIEDLIVSSPDVEEVRGFASKLAEHALRIAGALALFEQPRAKVIMGDTMKSAIEVAKFYLKEQLRINGISRVGGELKRAQKVLEYLKGYDYFTLQQLYQFGPTFVRSREAAVHFIKILTKHGWIEQCGPREINGRTYKTAYRLKQDGKVNSVSHLGGHS